MNKYLLLFFLIFSSLIMQGQQVSTKGKDFWMGFMNNIDNSGNFPELSLYISSLQNTSGIISIPGQSWSQSFTVAANTTTKVVIPNNAVVMSNGMVEGKGIHITTTDIVSVYALNYKQYSSDASVIFPTNSLDREYRILTIQSWPYNMPEEYLIVATEDSSIIEIKPYGGFPYIINLNEGQTYQIMGSIQSQLSGTIVKVINGCQKIAVFGGSVAANIGGCQASDHLFEQLLPVSRFGNNFITTPLMNKSKDYFRIIAHTDNTSITIDGGMPIILSAGQVYQFSTSLPSYIQSTQPVCVFQYAQGNDCDGVGDPFSVIVSPIEQSINDITFNAFFSNVITSYFVNIVTPTAYTSFLTLDGSPVTFTSTSWGSTYSYARVAINQGNHRLVSPYGFTASVYGFGLYESYGYSVGFSMNNLQYDFTIVPNHACSGIPINFSAQSYSNIANYQWIFGDGTTGSGLNTTNIYTTGGTYTVALVLSETGGCKIDTLWKVLQIEQSIPPTILNPVICQGATYTVGTHTYATSGTYSDTLLTSVGCDSVIITNLTVNPISPTILNPLICQGETFVVGNDSYSMTGTYIDTLTTLAGCDSIIITNLTVKPLPVVNLGNGGIICEGDSVELVINPNYTTYLWQDGSTNNSFVVSQAGNYWVIVNYNDCIKSDFVKYYVCADDIKMWIPNSFTPNGDGLNDIFKVETIVEFSKFQMFIYNRWDQLIFESTDPTIGWNGKFNGELVPFGVYTYSIRYTVEEYKQEKIFRGRVTVVQ